MEIAVKESTAAVVEKGEVAEVVQPASKKRKVSNAATEEAARGKGATTAQPSSSQAAPAASKGDSFPAWDPLLHPMEFIEKAVSIMG
ncbi:hypothetical protein A2U01_0079744, partial [Trifolium medium]|nr:hypothetical protein [Trifolium medium]